MLGSVGLVMNRANTDAVKCAGKAASILRGHGIDAYEMEKEKKKEPAGMIISFGGDGTLLRAAGYAVENSIPLLGINLGTVGFLTEEEPSNLKATLRRNAYRVHGIFPFCRGTHRFSGYELHDPDTCLRPQHAAVSLCCLGIFTYQSPAEPIQGADRGTTGRRTEPHDAQQRT